MISKESRGIIIVFLIFIFVASPDFSSFTPCFRTSARGNGFCNKIDVQENACMTSSREIDELAGKDTGHRVFQLWNKTINEGSLVSASGIVLGPDGLFIIGKARSLEEKKFDIHLEKYNFDGELLWYRTFEGSPDHEVDAISIEPEGVFLLIRRPILMLPSGNAGYDAVLLKFSYEGEVLWNRSFGKGRIHYLAKGMAIGSGGVYIWGKSLIPGLGEYWNDTFLLKYTFDGELVWNKSWNDQDLQNMNCINAGPDGIYVAGTVYSGTESDMLLAKYDFHGKLLWKRVWGSKGDEEAYDLAIGYNGVYVAGESSSYGEGESRAFLLRYGSNGELLWSRFWKEEGGKAKAVVLGLDGIYLAGEKKSLHENEGHIFLLKYDFDGNLLWSLGLNITGRKSVVGLSIGPDGIYMLYENVCNGSVKVTLIKFTEINVSIDFIPPISLREGEKGNARILIENTAPFNAEFRIEIDSEELQISQKRFEVKIRPMERKELHFTLMPSKSGIKYLNLTAYFEGETLVHKELSIIVEPSFAPHENSLYKVIVGAVVVAIGALLVLVIRRSPKE